MVRGGIGLGRKRRRGGRRGRRGLLHPLGKGILRAPGALAVIEEALPVQAVGSALGFDVHASSGSPGRFRLNVAGRHLHLADRRLAYRGSVRPGPRLRHSCRFLPVLPQRSLPGRILPRSARRAKCQALAHSIDRNFGWLASVPQRNLALTSCGRCGGGRIVQHKILPAPPAHRQGLQLGCAHFGSDCRGHWVALARDRQDRPALRLHLPQGRLRCLNRRFCQGGAAAPDQSLVQPARPGRTRFPFSGFAGCGNAWLWNWARL